MQRNHFYGIFNIYLKTLTTMGEGSILEETIDDGKQANIIRSSDHLKDRLDRVIRVRDENEVEPNEVEPNDEEHEEEPEICKCCGQIIK